KSSAAELEAVDGNRHPYCHVLFFVQAEDGIRDRTVTGVQTCALPIFVVDSAALGPAAALSPRARGLLAVAPPPARSDRVALSVILPSDTVLVGAQLDVIAAAWFPRELRTRLRRMPILTMQTPEGVWSYPGASPSEPAASRLVRGGWMDLFVAHQIVFPLAVGRVTIPPATVEYAVPVSFSFFSREERYSLKSDSVLVTVLPLPLAGRSTDDPRVVAHGLALDVAIEPAEARVGEPLDVTVTVAGLGNVALWPEPAIHWPAGFRTYPGEATVRVESQGGQIGGSKTFHYLAVPDSVGAFLLPEVRYAYYDRVAGDAAVARAAPRALAVGQGAEPRAARPLPPLDRSARAAGVESAVADHVMRLRDRLRAARYGPRGLGDAAELAAELAQVLKVLDAEPAGGRHRRWLVAVCLGALVGAASLPGLAVAQAP